MDLASFIGILSGTSLIAIAILFDGSIRNFVNVPGLMIVMGGTMAATLLTFPLKEVLAAFRAAFSRASSVSGVSMRRSASQIARFEAP